LGTDIGGTNLASKLSYDASTDSYDITAVADYIETLSGEEKKNAE
jgi:hypothetical protein